MAPQPLSILDRPHIDCRRTSRAQRADQYPSAGGRGSSCVHSVKEGCGRAQDPYRWDERVEAWEEVAASDAFLAIRDRIVELAEPRRDDRVVDLGAGTGLLTLALAPRVHKLVAVDISERMLERLDDAAIADGIHNVETLVADLRRLPLEDESATLVVSNYAFHHLDDTGKELALAEARRILQPGGRVVICDMMFSLSSSRATGGS